MKVSSGFRLTIPGNVREQLEMHPGTEVEFIIDDDEVFLRSVDENERQASKVEVSASNRLVSRRVKS